MPAALPVLPTPAEIQAYLQTHKLVEVLDATANDAVKRRVQDPLVHIAMQCLREHAKRGGVLSAEAQRRLAGGSQTNSSAAEISNEQVINLRRENQSLRDARAIAEAEVIELQAQLMEANQAAEDAAMAAQAASLSAAAVVAERAAEQADTDARRAERDFSKAQTKSSDVRSANAKELAKSSPGLDAGLARASSGKRQSRVSFVQPGSMADLGVATVEQRVSRWVNEKLAAAPRQSELLQLRRDLEKGPRQAWLLKQTAENYRCVNNLFKTLHANANHDARFAEIGFGISNRQKDVRDVIRAEPWDGGLPLMVPVKHVRERLPDYFIDGIGGLVHYSEAWPSMRIEIDALVTRLAGDAKAFPQAAWDSLRKTFRESREKYDRAWDQYVKPQTKSAREELMNLTEVEAGNEVLQGVDSDDVDILLGVAAKARTALMSRLATQWTASPKFDTAIAKCVARGLPPTAKLVMAAIKDKVRVVQKASDKYQALGSHKHRRVRDLARMCCVCLTLDDVNKSINWFKETFRVVMLENRFAKETNMGWRDVTLLIELDVEGGRFLVEVQVQLEALATVRDEQHAAYKKVREHFTGKLSLHAEQIEQKIIESFYKFQAPSKLQQPVHQDSGVLRLYFRKGAGFGLTIGQLAEFSQTAMLPAETFRELGMTAKAYFARCLEQADASEVTQASEKKQAVRGKLPFEDALLSDLKVSLFNADGSLRTDTKAFFHRQAGAPPRCSSYAVPLAHKATISHYLKTMMPLGSPARLAHFGKATGMDDLMKRVNETTREVEAGYRPTSASVATNRPKAEFFHEMDWSKVEENPAGTRGVVFLLQGVRKPDVHHIWSCADKGAKDSAGRFYKEPNVEGLGWTLDQLATDLDEVLGLVAVLVSMNGD